MPITSSRRPILICGIDAEGDARELGASDIERAQKLVAIMMHDWNDGTQPWRSWTIWWNDPARNGEWCVHSQSE